MRAVKRRSAGALATACSSDDEQTATLVGVFGDEESAGFRLGDRLDVEPGMASWTVLPESKVGRVDGYDGVPGDVARRMREAGFQNVVAVPIAVAGATWGALVATLRATIA